jgi:hypothetical protein
MWLYLTTGAQNKSSKILDKGKTDKPKMKCEVSIFLYWQSIK